MVAVRSSKKKKVMEQVVTKIAYSSGLNFGKYQCLKAIALRLGLLRTDLWNKYGSILAWDKTSYTARAEFERKAEHYQVSYKQWEGTLLSVIDDIHAVQTAAKEAVVKELYKRYGKKQGTKLARLLKKFSILKQNNLLHRLVRKHYFRGHTRVKNQIVIPGGCYSTFIHRNITWLAVPSLQKGKRINIPLNSQYDITGRIRLILRNNRVEVHFTSKINCRDDCGDKEIGIDRGYTEVFVDSEEEFFGTNFGNIQTSESESRNSKQKKRNKLLSVLNKAKKKGNYVKANRIEKNNLGLNKWNRRERRFKSRVSDLAYKSVHQLCNKASTIVYEDLTEPIASNKPRSKKRKRSLNSWVKGTVITALEQVSARRGSTIVDVNAAYTSQMDSRYGVLLGERKGDSFYCFDGVVIQADINAARNVLARKSDAEITPWTSFKQVKSILLKRTEQFKKSLTGESESRDIAEGESLQLVLPLFPSDSEM